MSTHSRLDMASSDLLCNLDISLRISHDFTRSGHIFSHHPSPPYLVFQVQHILLSPYAFTSVDPGQYLCLSIPFPLSSSTYFPQCAYPFTVIISECYACMCISIHSLWCDGLFRVTHPCLASGSLAAQIPHPSHPGIVFYGHTYRHIHLWFTIVDPG